MSKNNSSFSEIIISIIIIAFLYDCIYGDRLYNTGHNFLTNTGINQKIEKFEKERGIYHE